MLCCRRPRRGVEGESAGALSCDRSQPGGTEARVAPEEDERASEEPVALLARLRAGTVTKSCKENRPRTSPNLALKRVAGPLEASPCGFVLLAFFVTSVPSGFPLTGVSHPTIAYYNI